MSMSAVQEFLTKVSQDQTLQEQVAKAMESDNDRQAVTDLAHAQGFDFTAEELGQEIQTRAAAAQQQASELSEDELESVAGGAGFIPSMMTMGIPSIKISVVATIGTNPIKVKW